jgi:hypothetical protein
MTADKNRPGPPPRAPPDTLRSMGVPPMSITGVSPVSVGPEPAPAQVGDGPGPTPSPAVRRPNWLCFA